MGNNLRRCSRIFEFDLFFLENFRFFLFFFSKKFHLSLIENLFCAIIELILSVFTLERCRNEPKVNGVNVTIGHLVEWNVIDSHSHMFIWAIFFHAKAYAGMGFFFSQMRPEPRNRWWNNNPLFSIITLFSSSWAPNYYSLYAAPSYSTAQPYRS